MITHPRQTLLDDSDFRFDLTIYELEPGVLMHIVHLDVFRWTPTVFRRLLKVWPEVRATLPPIVFTHGHVDDHKFHKFVTHFGGRHIHYTPCSDGQTRRIYAHYLIKG